MGASLLTAKPVSGSIRERHFDVSAGDNTWVRFDDDEGDDWVGVFGNGDISLYCAAVPFHDGHDHAVLVIAGGQGYIVDSATRALVRKTSWSYAYSSHAALGRDFIVVADTTEIWIVRRRGDTYVTVPAPSSDTLPAGSGDRQLAADGVVFQESDRHELVGVVWQHDGWYRFRLRYDGLEFQKGERVGTTFMAFAGRSLDGGFPMDPELGLQMERYRL